MKFMIVIVASLASAGLVLPTVTQGQTGGFATQLASAAPSKAGTLRA
jgi:hypothetical protein